MLQLPLHGVRVIDLSRVLAGPWCTMVLRHLGAEVIKLEAPPTGDDARSYGPFLDRPGGQSAYFISVNSGKRSLAIDLKTPEGKEVLGHLIERADVLVENYRPGTLERLGFPAGEILRRNPRIVFASISGFGQSGPDAQRPAYDIIIQALSGLMSITGTEEGESVKVGASISDIVAGIYAALGIAAALFRRERTGVGARVDVAMLDCTVSLLENAIARYLASGVVPQPLGSRHPSITPFDAFQAQDSAIVIAAGNDRLFAALCDALQRPALARDPRFRTNASRTQNAAALKQELNSALREHGTEHWLRELEGRGIPCARIQTVADVLTSPQLEHRKMLVPVGEGEIRVVGNPIKYGETGEAELEMAPALGADSVAILREVLGYPEGRIARLMASGAVRGEP